MNKRIGNGTPPTVKLNNQTNKATGNAPGSGVKFGDLVNKTGSTQAQTAPAKVRTAPVAPPRINVTDMPQSQGSLGPAGAAHMVKSFKELAELQKSGKITGEQAVERGAQESLRAVYGDKFVKSSLGQEAVNYIKKLVVADGDPFLNAQFSKQGIIPNKGG